MTLERDDVLRNIADRMIRESLQHPENLRGLLQRAVPDLAGGFEVAQAELLEREFPGLFHEDRKKSIMNYCRLPKNIRPVPIWRRSLTR